MLVLATVASTATAGLGEVVFAARRDDGRFDVACVDGAAATVDLTDLLAGRVCGGGHELTCREGGGWYYVHDLVTGRDVGGFVSFERCAAIVNVSTPRLTCREAGGAYYVHDLVTGRDVGGFVSFERCAAIVQLGRGSATPAGGGGS
jgi:hypothetical protein